MKKIDVIDLVLKLFGIKIFVGALLLIKDIVNFSQIFNNSNNHMTAIGGIIGYFMAFLVLVFISYVLVFKTNFFTKLIIKNDTEINFTPGTNYVELLHLSLIIMGLVIVVFRLPAFIAAVAEIIKYVLGNMSQPSHLLFQQIGTLILYIFGYILITSSRSLAERILRISRKENM
ncbi:hypothetical protein ACE1ET_10760 [Saccharicrinis sp. FJH62]|uniref:hypothetical protein n=1 Tax=Saccharicrinis sp. FJH62 TaxID=3344657 RepID=UPI0035D515CF